MNRRTGHQIFMSLAAALAVIPLLLLAFQTFSLAEMREADFREGDVIFQEAASSQSAAIQEATGSRYTHCGLVFEYGGKMMVYEALGTMSRTPLARWISRGVDHHYVLMRLKDRDKILTPEKITAMKTAGRALADKKYDLMFQWSDDTIYCSELVWKIYERGAGLVLIEPRTFRDFNLNGPAVRAVAQKRYGQNLPLDEKVVTPSDLMVSPWLETVGPD